MGLAVPPLKARALAEPLLWLAVASGVLWCILLAAATSYVETAGSHPVADHMSLQSGVLAVLLLGSAGAALVLRRTPLARRPALVAGLALAASGHGFSRIEDIAPGLQPVYVWGSVAAGVLLVVLALRPGWDLDTDRAEPGVAGQLVAALLVLGAVAGAAVIAAYSSWGWLGVWVEQQPAWDYAVPVLLLSTGLLAAAAQAWRRRWAASATTVVVGALAALLLLWGI